MYKLLFLAIFSFSLPSFSADAKTKDRKPSATISATDQQKLDALASKKISKDFRIVFTEKKAYKVCGGEGDAYLGQVQMNKYSRGYDEAGKPQITDRWVKVNKIYTIYKSDLNAAHPELFDVDHCME